MVEYTISTRVDWLCVESVLGAIVLKLALLKSHRDNKSCIWVRGFLLTYIPVQFPEYLVCIGLRRM